MAATTMCALFLLTTLATGTGAEKFTTAKPFPQCRLKLPIASSFTRLRPQQLENWVISENIPHKPQECIAINNPMPWATVYKVVQPQPNNLDQLCPDVRVDRTVPSNRGFAFFGMPYDQLPAGTTLQILSKFQASEHSNIVDIYNCATKCTITKDPIKKKFNLRCKPHTTPKKVNSNKLKGHRSQPNF